MTRLIPALVFLLSGCVDPAARDGELRTYDNRNLRIVEVEGVRCVFYATSMGAAIDCDWP